MAYEVTINGVTRTMTESELYALDINTVSRIKEIIADTSIKHTSLDLCLEF